MTNAEWIRSMSNEELATFLEDYNACSRCLRRGNDCFPVANVEEWLEREYIMQSGRNER